MNVAVCDDEKLYINEMKKYISRISEKNGIRCEIFEFYNGMELVHYCRNHPMDIIMIDIEMPVMDGFEAVGTLQKLQPDTAVIFVTSHDELACQAYDYTPFWFVKKDNMQKLDDVLNRCIKTYKQKRQHEDICMVTTDDGVVSISCGDVIYLESAKHYIDIHSDIGETRKIRCGMEAAYRQLQPYDFIRVQRCFVVNCRYIGRITSQYVKLTNEQEFTVTRDKAAFNEIQQTYRRFLRRQRW